MDALSCFSLLNDSKNILKKTGGHQQRTKVFQEVHNLAHESDFVILACGTRIYILVIEIEKNVMTKSFVYSVL